MKGITIATFISNNEYESKEFYNLTEYLKKIIDVQIIIFSNKEIKNDNIKVFVTPQMTKYKRIQLLLNEAKFNDILCLDNDIAPNKANIVKFVYECLNKDYSIAWGKVKTQTTKGFIPKLIGIDKNLSHNYIRPILWNLNIGISLPGQIFIINKKYLKNQLPNIDTVYDDLMIGATVRGNNYPVYFTKEVLGYEKPKENIRELLKQRIRWAKGLAETIFYNRKNKSLPYIIIHGFTFNLLWVPVYMVVFELYKINFIFGLIATLYIVQFLAEKQLKNLIWSIMYLLVFPFVYLVWGGALILNLVRIKITNKGMVNKIKWMKSLKFYYKKPVNMQKKES